MSQSRKGKMIFSGDSVANESNPAQATEDFHAALANAPMKINYSFTIIGKKMTLEDLLKEREEKQIKKEESVSSPKPF